MRHALAHRILLLVILGLFLAGCAAPAASTSTPAVEQPAATLEPAQTPAGEPKVGGTLVLIATAEPGTLDPHIATEGIVDVINAFIGGALVAKDPATGSIVPYLAESWTVSDDGLVMEFKLRQDVKFHDGSPFTAQDYVYTFERARDPATQATVALSLLAPVTKAEAPEPYTLRLTLAYPYASFLNTLADAGYMMPLLKKAVDQYGDEYGLHPVGVGPYKLKEWKTGDRIILERNPDYNWAPAYAHQGPAYIQNIEYRIIPEEATAFAGLEAGEVDLLGITPQNLQRVKDSGKFQIFSSVSPGMMPYVLMNLSKPPFDDVRVRQAFNLAVDKAALIKVAALGNAVAQNGPLSSSVLGYWPEIESMGYPYDLEKAKTLLQEAGYTAGADGMLQKDGQPLSLTMKILPLPDAPVVAQVLQQQYKALGVDIQLEQGDPGVIFPTILTGDYSLALHGVSWPDADVLYLEYHSSGIGATNFARAADPELDKLLEAERSTMDPAARQEVINQAQKYIVDQALAVPLYASNSYIAVNNRVHGIIFSQFTGAVFADAYIVE